MGSLHVNGPAAPGNATFEHSGVLHDESSPQFYSSVETAVIIKWSVVGGIFVLFALWILVGHLHARARLRKGLPLLFYHKYLISASEVASSKGASSAESNVYHLRRMDNPEYYAPPPPAYDPTQPPPPSYQPTEANSETSTSPPTETTPSQLEQQAEMPKKSSFLSKIRRLGRDSK